MRVQWLGLLAYLGPGVCNIVINQVSNHAILHQQRPTRSASAFISPSIFSLGRPKEHSSLLMASSSNENTEFGTTNSKQKRRRIISPQINAYAEQQISTIFSEGNKKFVPLSLAGRWFQKSIEVETILLSSPEHCQDIADIYEQYLKSQDNSTDSQPSQTSHPALPIPISMTSSNNAIKLLSQTYSNTPLSKSVLLSLNSLFINRDGGLFDNLPWSTWSIDPNLQERDAANNVVDGKFTMGKRVAYQRFMGKDWQGRSLSLGNLANKVRYLLEQQQQSEEDGESSPSSYSGGDGMDSTLKEEDIMLSLSQRLLQLEMKEAQMDIAECEQRLAISKTTQSTEDSIDNVDENEATKQLKKACDRLQVAETSLQELMTAMQSSASNENTSSFLPFVFPWDNNKKKKDSIKQSKKQSLLSSILDKLTDQENPAPYRGAIGYPAKLDSKKEMFEDSILPYSSPYELLLETIDEQLNSEVMGCVLEPTSLLEGNLVLGGALLLKRKGVQKSTTLAGEVVSYTDDGDALGNEGVLPRSMYVVECYSDEAIGMAMASETPLFVEEEIYSRAGRVPVELDVETATVIKMDGENKWVEDMDSLSFMNHVPPIRPLDESYFSSQLEGEKISSEKESNLVRIPLTTNPQLFDGPNQTPQSSSSSSTRSSVFSTFNPVKNIDEYDELKDEDKARLLLKLESFRDILPRPRAIRTSTKTTNDVEYDSGSPPSLLDNILIPLVDESIRRQYLIRDAERRKDFNEADALREEVSPRQVALESAQRAREEGFDYEADRLEEEARLYKSLRADVTQDEGAYDRYLDRDEWYERETRARIKRLDKSKFGTLLDGIDLP
mmetsp:Transcript_10061/g.18092  ORF Transcript_10061/g.18092 Transcript_10061/m.18092 type:complete len:839 (-) Transcript_10061:153-2669(-)|eukprot:CAMPEP_0201920770 /NCGR_PEP_ID=MMETSP0903-20130614/9277_1 /ASSEMBLY_ACC=CAM_ASM_000552 /TAXON_ID=420261 /ORGANISM="Thalassiosira antarctica, Strain CCMP982" /LENGTH=838 /DNA_ID=CAMNT_0048457585 /DNA_START=46 /DNA_END=2562 /DNA_ORIENTATION=+